MKILEICVDLDGGGIDRYLYNYCTRIKDIHFDFAVVDSKRGILEEDLVKRNCVIFRVPRLSDGVNKNFQALTSILSQGNYDAVHVHLGYKSFVALFCAKRNGVKTRIVHAHIANEPENIKGYIARKICTMLTKVFATDFAACGADAAKWVWGKRKYNSGQVKIHNNAIETKKYVFNEKTRIEYRRELGISEGALTVGHVGRLCEQKNQLRLLDIFKLIHQKCVNSYLVLIGRGEQEQDVQRKIKSLNLESSVIMLGIRNDVPKLLNIMDVFVFPSKYEGLPFTLVETQCNGLPVVSSSIITNDVRVCECMKPLDLNASDEEWAETALFLAKKGRKKNAREKIIKAGFDIDSEAEKLKEYYIETIQKRE